MSFWTFLGKIFQELLSLLPAELQEQVLSGPSLIIWEIPQGTMT